MLAVTGLRVRYGEVLAVTDVGFQVARGETLAVLGHSGSGKTTILKAIAGLVPIEHGRVELDGRDLTGVPTHRRRIGMVFQDFALFPHLDVGANVAYGLAVAGLTSTERVATALEEVGLGGLERRRIDQLSGGQAQRVALARTLVTEPDLLLLDEPLGSLDPDVRREVAAELADLLASTGIPALVVTHDPAEAFSLGARLAVIVDGRIAAIGAPDALWREPGSVDVARLVGHRTLLTVAVTDGRTVVGGATLAVRAPDGPATILLRSGAITTPGPARGRVAGCRFEGPGWVATVVVDDQALEVPVPHPVAAGAVLGFTIDPAGVTTLAT